MKDPALRLLGILRPQAPILSLGILAEILKYGVTLWIGLLGVDLLRMARSGTDQSLLISTGLLILALAGVRGVCGYASPYLCHVGAYHLLADLRDLFYRTLDPLAPAALMHRRTGDIVSVAVNNVETLELFFAHTIAPLVTAILIPIAVFISLLFIHPLIAGVYVLCTLLIALLPRLSLHLNEKRGEDLRERLADIHSFLIDSVQGIREILAFSRSETRHQEIMRLNAAYQEELGAYVQKNSWNTACYLLLVSGGIISLLTLSSLLAASGSVESLKLPIIILFASVGFSSMANIIEISKQFSLTFAGAKRLFDLMDLVPAVQEPEHPDHPDLKNADIYIKNLSFRYRSEEPRVLKSINLTVPRGNTVAVVGMTGAGKTTLSHLIMRFWDPEEGEILLGGYDLRSLPLSLIRDTIAMVTQDIFLMNTTILENIRMGRASASDGEVMAAARAARLEEFIDSLPKRYGTLVGERGIRLSGGERQRIAIARAILKDAPVLILDEATSALDTCTELSIRETLTYLGRGKTVVIIAHRLSTIVHADSIVVMKEGEIVEEGTHTELLGRGGVYASLIAAQEI